MHHFKKHTLEDGSIKLVISRKNVPVFLIIILGAFTVAGFAIPIFATIMHEEGKKQTLLVAYVVFWACAVYLLRLVLWNIMGKQVFLLKDGALTHYFDYGLFKDRKLSLEKDQYHFSVSKHYENESYIVLHHGHDRQTKSPYTFDKVEIKKLESALRNN